MANVIAVVGPSGKGKSTSIFPFPELKIQGLAPNETCLINVANKPLPTKGWKKFFNDKPISEGGNYKATDDADTIVKVLETIDKSRPDIKHVVIDDAQYLMAFAFIERARQKGYDKFSELAEIGFKPVNKAIELKRNDLFVFFIYHDELGDSGERKIKTAGKLLDNHITMEGLFTVVLFAGVEKNAVNGTMRYFFITNADGTCTAKSPYGMFKEQRIPNDLGFVKQSIINYQE